MSLPDFLRGLAQSETLQKSFFQKSRRAMLGALHRKFYNLPHQLLEDAVALTWEDLWRNKVQGFTSSHLPHEPAYQDDLSRYLANCIARHKVLDLLDRSKHKSEILFGDLGSNQNADYDDYPFESGQDHEDEPLSLSIERRQTLERLHRCIQHLSPKLKEVVQSLWREIKQAELATELGIPEGTVKSRMNEAIKKLKACMGLGAREEQA